MRVGPLEFESFSTGVYGGGFDGVTLQFIDLVTGENYCAIFNAELSRKRSTRRYQAGTRLPGKQFRISRRHLFYRFWRNTGLPVPPRLGAFHDYMGNLRKLQFSGELVADKPNRLSASSLQPLQINRLPHNAQHSDNEHTVGAQQTATAHTSKPYNNSQKEQASWAFSANRSTNGSNHEARLIRGKVTQDARLKEEKAVKQVRQMVRGSTKLGHPSPVSEMTQEREDWLKDYGSE